MPFEIPESWCWTTIDDVNLYNSSSIEPNKSPYKDFELYSVPTFESGMPEFVKGSEISSAKKIVAQGDVLLCKINPHLNRAWIVTHYDRNRDCIASSEWIICRNNNIEPRFLAYCFTSPYFMELMLSNVSGVGGSLMRAQPASVGKYIFPLPPIKEQIRIVVELDKWLMMIDELDIEKQDLFLYIKQIKSKILDLAISGKLVPQDPDDEPAIELLKRINPSFKPCDNSHYENIEFDIPKNWVWATIGDIFEHNTGKALNASNPNGTMLDYITTSNLYWDRFELSIIKQMPFTESEIERCIVRKGDLLICEGGDVGRAAIWDYDYNIMIQNHIHRLRGKVDICTRYFFYLFMHYKLHNIIGGKGVAIQGLSSRDLHNLIIPVPSLKEQYDIASSIDLYFSKLDMITAEL